VTVNKNVFRLFCATALAALLAGPSLAHESAKEARLPKIGPAPEFTLTDIEGKKLSLTDLRGQVVALTFVFTSCADTCPVLTAKLVGIQRKLSAQFKPKVFFVAITVDPERDTREVLKRYAQAHGADPAHWAFLTGSPAQIAAVTRDYGIYNKKQAKGDVDHTFLTSLIDAGGTLRVQYLGWRFKPEEFSADLRALAKERARP
jgi:protein SCO1